MASLYIRRKKLALQYITKLAASPQNPAYNDIFQPLYKQFYENQPITIKPLGLRIDSIIKEANIDIQKVAKISLPQTEPWTLKTPEILFELTKEKSLKPTLYFLKINVLKSSSIIMTICLFIQMGRNKKIKWHAQQ